MYSLNESILNSLKEAFLLEDYKSAKVKLVEKGASEDEADSLIVRHKELKKLNRLDKSLIDIDKIVKEFSPSELKQKLFNISTQTKSEIKKHIEGKIVAENEEYWVYKIDTPEEAYRFHGLTKWCICSGNEENAKEHFEYYSNEYKNVFYFFVRKQITDPKDVWNYVALERRADEDDVYWDMKDDSHELSDIPVKLPEFNKPPLEKLSLEERLEKAGFKKNSDGEYDVDGSISLSDLSNSISDLITDGKLNIKFGKVSGYFDCSKCNNLTSLEGCPREVNGYFNCSDCKNLTSLKGAPEKVGGTFCCFVCKNLINLEGCPREVGGDFNCGSCNNLTSLNGAPEKISGDFNCCGHNNLTSLKGAPREVGGVFNCSFCENLTSLKGAPEKVGGNFDCQYCKNLASLEGYTKEVGGNFNCSECKNLITLKGAPEKVSKDFNTIRCYKLKSLEGVTREVGGDFYCGSCGTDFTENDVKEHCNVSGTIRV